MKQKRKVSLGSISSGTMQEGDLIPTFCNALREYGVRDRRLSAIEKRTERDNYFGTDDAYWDLEWLFDKLNELAPDFCYFGAHPGDASDYGFYVSDSLEYDFDGLKVSDLSEVPDKYTGYILHVNDHGNMTLYYKSPRKLTELWAIV